PPGQCSSISDLGRFEAAPTRATVNAGRTPRDVGMFFPARGSTRRRTCPLSGSFRWLSVANDHPAVGPARASCAVMKASLLFPVLAPLLALAACSSSSESADDQEEPSDEGALTVQDIAARGELQMH